MVESDNGWRERWDARVRALTAWLGEPDDPFGVAPGSDVGDGPVILSFRRHLDGVVYASAELIGHEDRPRNVQGAYEIMVCVREDADDWGPALVSRLARISLDTALEPGAVARLGSASLAGSRLVGVLFADYARATVLGNDAGLLLAIGITAEEVDACRRGETARVRAALDQAGIYPFTDPERESVLVEGD